MKEIIKFWIGTVLVFVFSSSAFSQNDIIIIPELDVKKNTYNLIFSPDPQNEKVISAYMKGETEPDSLRFKAEISKVVERIMVTVITEDPGQEIKIDIVKNNWKDVKRSGKTSNGIYQISFDTAEKFGIILTSSEVNVPFNLAVWTSGALMPKSDIFYAVDNTNSIANTSLKSSDGAELVESNGSQENHNMLYYIVGLLAIIAILLLFILIKKKSNKSTLLLIIFFLGQTVIYSNARRSNSAGFQQAIVNAMKNSDEFMEVIFKMDDYASALNALQQGMDDMKNYLDEMEKGSDVDMDPAGQPRLPSSCLSSYTNRDPNENNSSGNGNDRNGNDSPNSRNESNEGSKNQDEFQPMDAAGDNSNDKPDNGPGEMPSSEKESLQLPRYDQNGNLINAGDFPNAPTHISTSGKGNAKNPYIDNGANSSQSNPTYDRNGHLKYPEEFPDAPRKIDLNTGLPIMRPVMQGQQQQGPQSIKQPLYDKNGTLIDAGDYPNAPSKIDPRKIDANAPLQNPFTGGSSEGSSRPGEPKEQSQNATTNEIDNDFSSSGNGGAAGSSSMSNNNPSNTGGSGGSRNPEEGKGPGPGEAGGPGNPGDGNGPGSGGPGSSRGPRDRNDANKKAGCECLKKAYAQLDERRFLLEQLRIITANLDRYTDYKIKYGDDVSSIHGVVGLTWQNEKIKVLKAMQRFDITYEQKYEEMIADLYEILLEIDRCETMLGFENWYSNAGFIYYSFMKDKYKRNK